MTDLRMGVYRHYKGNLYQVLGLAHDANAGELYSNRRDVARSSTRAPSGERIVVVYIGLQLDAAHEGPRLAVRTLEDFTGIAHIDDHLQRRPLSACLGCPPRFTYLGPEFTKDML